MIRSIAVTGFPRLTWRRAQVVVSLLCLAASLWLVSGLVLFLYRAWVVSTTTVPSGPPGFPRAYPTEKVWLFYLAWSLMIAALAGLRPSWRLFGAGVACMIAHGLLAYGTRHVYPSMLYHVPWYLAPPLVWAGIVSLPFGWLLLAASVRAVRLGATLYVAIGLAFHLAIRAIPLAELSGLLGSPTIVVFWPLGVWQIVGWNL